jgi:hypothetical protein
MRAKEGSYMREMYIQRTWEVPTGWILYLHHSQLNINTSKEKRMRTTFATLSPLGRLCDFMKQRYARDAVATFIPHVR